ncbi:SRPBCC family protein [Microbulbifer harenosus]|nr:SRPBCC domain-containing protein [Microbulbifer harenosus]
MSEVQSRASNIMTGDERTVVVEREFSHPPEKLWRALTLPHLIEEWLMKNNFRPVQGHHFNLQGEWGGVLDCEVLIVEQNKRLSYTWNFPHENQEFNLESVVTFTLTPTDTGTRLRMEQRGFRPHQKQAYQGAKFGWRNFFSALEGVLERS